jgi:hypothetical protein
MKYDLKIPYIDIIKMDLQIKDIENFPENYKTIYPFDKEICKKFFEKNCNYGKFSYHELFLLWFPDFNCKYKKTFETILSNKEIYLPYTWKIYLGIMAASTIRNEYLLRTLEGEFLINGGDEDWLILGLEGAPEKLKNLQILNNILAHQPWKINEKDIKDVLKTGNTSSSWNVHELVQAIVVLTTFHRLATVLECLKFDVKKNDDEEKKPNEKEKENTNRTFASASDYSEAKEISEDQSKDNNISKSIDVESSLSFIINEEGSKYKIINNLELMNQSNDSYEKSKDRKNSEIFEFEINTNQTEYLYYHTNDIIIDFSKYISKFCTVYLDFDNHSEEYKSYFVLNKLIFFFIFIFYIYFLYLFYLISY